MRENNFIVLSKQNAHPYSEWNAPWSCDGFHKIKMAITPAKSNRNKEGNADFKLVFVNLK